MQRYKCVVSYDGTDFFGYQVQPNKRTVQSELQEALLKLHKGKEVKVTASGRTDAGVHAKGQVIHFDSDLGIPEERWPLALNSLLPDDISILSAEKTEASFHARYDAAGKEYRYFLYLSKQREPFSRHYAFQFPYSLDVGQMREAGKLLLGTHDFTSFCSAKSEMEDKVRTIKEISINQKGDMLTFQFIGNGFLYNMVRILVGTLLEVGSGERKAEEISELLSKKDRCLAGKTAPAHGLYLWRVFY